jgi:hypothetical protein
MLKQLAATVATTAFIAMSGSAGAQTPPGPSKCSSAKVGAVRGKVGAKLNCAKKAISKGLALDVAPGGCMDKATTKFNSAFPKQEPAGDCLAGTGDLAKLEDKVDDFVNDVYCELGCPRRRITTTSSAGTLAVSTLPAFPFPAGVITTVDMQQDVGHCKYRATVPAGGFTVPVFCIPALGFTSEVVANGCEAGGVDGGGSVWPGNAPCPDGDVSRVADSSDGICDPGGACNIGGIGGNTNGDIDTTRGNGVCDPQPERLHMQLDIPVTSRTWNDFDGNCPDDDGVYSPGTDTLVTLFNFVLSPTTATAVAEFLDKDLDGSGPAVADGCSFAGNGPSHTRVCSAGSPSPGAACGNNADCSPGTCINGTLAGSPAAGPCCHIGDAHTTVNTGAAFSGAAPLYDLIFSTQTPATVTACDPPGAPATCTLTTNKCLD